MGVSKNSAVPPAASARFQKSAWLNCLCVAFILVLVAFTGYQSAPSDGTTNALLRTAPTETAGGVAASPTRQRIARAPSGSGGARPAPIIPASSASVPAWVETSDFGPAKMRFEQGSPLGRSHAQHQEDVTAHEKYFWGVKGGTFLEIGALDGLEISTSLMLEESADWRSVLIEASPGQFSRCRRNRPKALALNFAACSQARTIHYLDANAISEGRGAGGGIIEFMPTRMMRNNFGNVPELVAHLDLTGDDNIPCRITNAVALEALSYVQTVRRAAFAATSDMLGWMACDWADLPFAPPPRCPFLRLVCGCR